MMDDAVAGQTDAVTDEALLGRFVGGERDVLAELARRYEVRLLGLASGYFDQRRDLACDAIQETWLRVIRYASAFRRESCFKTWLYRIALSRCHDVLSRQARAEMGSGDDSLDPPSPAPLAAIAPDRAAAARETDSAVRQALIDLPIEKRSVLLLCYHDGLTHGEAASILKIPVGTLKSRLNAALRELRSTLAGEVPL